MWLAAADRKWRTSANGKMAEEENVSNNNGDANIVRGGGVRGENDGSLADFVTRNYEEQREARQRSGVGNPSAEDEERVDNFLERALSESRRMNAEVARSERRQNELYRELGEDRIQSWTMEHASEVLVTLPGQQPQDGPMEVMVNGSADEEDIMR